MIVLLIALMTWNGNVEEWPEPVLVLSDEDIVANGAILTSPEEALIWGGQLFVIDSNQSMVFVKKPDGQVDAFGKAGHGPGEFSTPPNFINVFNQLLVVEELNRHRASFFSMNGEFLKREKRKRSEWHLGNLIIRKLTIQEGLAQGKRYESVSDRCLIVDLPERSDLGFHYARAVIHPLEDGSLLTATLQGKLALYEEGCKVIGQLDLPLDGMVLEPRVNKVTTAIGKSLGYVGKAYIGGHLLIDVAAENGSRVWALIQDETRGKDEKNRWLYRLDVRRGTILGRRSLPINFDRIAYAENRLVFVANKDALVQVFNPNQLFQD